MEALRFFNFRLLRSSIRPSITKPSPYRLLSTGSSPATPLQPPASSATPSHPPASSATPPNLPAASATPSPTASSKAQLPYHVSRSRTNNLPIYTEFKGHGSQHLLLIRKVSGDTQRLRSDLIEAFAFDPKVCTVKAPANHVVIKCDQKRKPELEAWLLARGF